MGYQECPSCGHIVGKAFWEVFDQCPDCGQKWDVPEGEQERAISRTIKYALLCAVLSFVPLLGVIFGGVGIVMGVVGYRLRGSVVAWRCAWVSLLVGILAQGTLITLGATIWRSRLMSWW